MVQKLELSGYSCVWEEGVGRERERESRGRESVEAELHGWPVERFERCVAHLLELA